MEVAAVNTAAKVALSLIEGTEGALHSTTPFVLSIGSTPTAHAATGQNKAKLASLLHGTLELHAGTPDVKADVMCLLTGIPGNYALLDLQQLHTGLIDPTCIAQRVLSTVISYYPGRGVDGKDEALCDAGAIALSKDTGPSGDYGEVLNTSWRLGRISQEHGILLQNDTRSAPIQVGNVVQIVGQHACLTLAAHQWFYVVDSDGDGKGDIVEDIWVPWKGW